MLYRFKGLRKITKEPYTGKWYPLDDCISLNAQYWCLSNLCDDIKLEIKKGDDADAENNK